MGERQGEVKGVESKYARRAKVYRLYAERAIKQAVKRGRVSLEDGAQEPSEAQIEAIVEKTIDEHLFFARLDQNSEPEIVLTDRQKSKSINPPIAARR